MGLDTKPDGDDADGEAVRVPFAAFVALEAALAPLSLALGWLSGQNPLADFAWSVDAALLGVAAAAPMLALFALAVRYPVGPIGRVKAFFNRELAPALDGCGWPDLALISVAAGVGEEMLFRGYAQAAFSRLIGPAGGLALAASVFGLLHPVSLAYVAIAAGLGAYLGAAWLASGNLLSVIVAHALYDFVALVVLLRDRDAGD